MATFTDPTGHAWEINFTGGDIRKLKREAGLDLRDVLRPGYGRFFKILDDNDTFLDLMWLILGRTSPVPRDQFDFLFDRDTTAAAVAAVVEATFDFYRGPKVAAEVKAALQASAEQIEKATVEAVAQATDNIRTGRTSTSGASGSPESSASTIARSSSASFTKWPSAVVATIGSARRRSWPG